jgi:hypothetical protein
VHGSRFDRRQIPFGAQRYLHDNGDAIEIPMEVDVQVTNVSLAFPTTAASWQMRL